ncbi:MAG: hypothetical protein Q4D19_13705, partial [Lautropia sp.]|nr:hypothetical protein [Lautropia sp.]
KRAEEAARAAAEAQRVEAAAQARVAEQAAAAAQAQAQAQANANAQQQEQSNTVVEARNEGEAGQQQAQTGGPVTSAGMFQQQRNEGAADPGSRSEGNDAFPWNGDGSTVAYEGHQITTTVQANGDITYRTSSGAVPFERALDANGNVLTEVVGCTEQDGDGPQECTFKAAS